MRKAWLAGSLPGETPAEAMSLALDILGDRLLALPGGEVGRPIWAASITEELADNPLFRVTRPGANTNYDDLTQLAAAADLDNLDLGHYSRFMIENPIAQFLLRDRQISRFLAREDLDIPFQVGFPSPFDQTLISVGKARYLKYRKAFTAATLRDVQRIHAMDPTVLFQIEAPLELIGILEMPRIARPVLTRRMARQITGFVRQCPAGIRMGVHLCLGRLNNRPKVALDQLAPLVDLGSAIVEHWPSNATLAFLQLPLAAGYMPPPLGLGWYTDLLRLNVPTDVRVILGLCHERVTTAQLRPILEAADVLLGRTVDVGASCGLALGGERNLDDVRTILTQQAQLCQGVS